MNWSEVIRDAAQAAGHSLDRDVVDELASHADAALDAAFVRGQTLADAEAHVRALIGVWILDPSGLERAPKRAAAIPPPPATTRVFNGLIADVRYAMRLARRQRASGLLAILTIALAIGVITTLFSVVDAVLLRPLPWPESDRLVRFAETHAGATRQMPWTMTDVAYLPWVERQQTAEAAGAWQRTAAALTSPSGSERIAVTAVTPSVFTMLRVLPLVGQVFTKDNVDEVVLSHGFWQERFAGNPDAIGQALTLNGRRFVIVGVMPREFMFPDGATRLWLPYFIPPPVSPDGKNRSTSAFSVMARLRPGVTAAQVAAEATAVARSAPDVGRAALALFGTSGPADIAAVPALDALTLDVKPGLIAMFAAVSLLLLTAVANIANLQLARAATRSRELAIRSAIGAGTSRLVQQLVIENLVLAGVGGILGLAISAGLHRALPSVLPADFPRLDNIGLTWSVTVFAALVASFVGVAVGLLPALRLRRLRLVDGLVEHSGRAIGGRRGRARTVLMVAQVAAACALLVGGSLLMRSFRAMTQQDLGFVPDHVLTARLGLPDYAFKPETRRETLIRFLERARALPGTPAVALTTGLPLSGSETLTAFTMPSIQPPVGKEIVVNAVRSVVTPGYFEALGVRLAQGRTFQATDDSETAPKVVLVNRTFARQYLTPTAIGDRVSGFMRDDGVAFEVIGIVEDAMRRGLTDATQPEIYSLLRQSAGPAPNHELVLRTSGDPETLIQPLRALVRELSPFATLETVRTMEARIAGSLARPRLYALALIVFAISAVVIAAVGLFGVLSYSVAQRTREMALRSALGARPAQICALVLRQGMAVTFIGIIAGLVIAYASVRYLSTLLYGISSHDLTTFLAAPLAIVLLALAACAAPAVRALRVDPIRALRS